MDKLSISLLGRAEIRWGDARLAGALQNKSLAILAYLAAEHRPHSRELFSDLLWPHLSRDAARANLRKAVFRLRQAPGCADVIETRADALSLAPDRIRLDVAELLACLPACAGSAPSPECTPCLERMERSVALYRGPFLEGFRIEGAAEFEDWLCIKRETCLRHVLGLLERLCDCHERNGTLVKATRFAARRLELESMDEAGHRRLMRLLARTGQLAAALTQFESCRRILHGELGSAPDAQTVALFRQIRADGSGARGCAEAAPAPRAGRRQVTALYCSFSISGSEPEEAAERMLQTQEGINRIIRQFGGYISQMHGGALLGYFGYPVAREDASRKAVQAALAVHRLENGERQIRTGLHTGLVVASAEMPDAMGQTSTHAVQVRDARHPVMISEATRQLVGGYFRVEPEGVRDLDHAGVPVPVYRVLGESGAQHRLAAAAQLTNYVGRNRELDTLAGAWRHAQSGNRQIVFIQGEAGIGKSRLIHAFLERLGGDACTVRELRCFSEFSQSPFHPLIAMLESLCGFTPADTPDEKLARLACHIDANYPDADPHALPLLAQLLSLPCAPSADLPPASQKEILLGLLIRLLQALAQRRPVLYVVEDLHWIDPSTRELITLFINGPYEGAILMLLTARPEFDPPWEEGRELSMELAPLARHEVANMVRSLSANISRASLQRIVARSDGVPLFAEEMARMAQEKPDNIPPTLHDLLAAQLDTLGEAKRTAQLAATIGREFDLDLLRRISPDPMLDQLHDAGLLAPAGHGWQFRHALIQEAAYQSQTRADRQAAHLKIGEAIQAHFPKVAERCPEIVAQHFSAGGNARQAVEYWIKAGKRASEHSANMEAIAHFRFGMQLLPQLPAGPAADHVEFALQVGLGIVLHATQGYGSPQAAEAFTRAMSLCGHSASPEVFQTIWGLWVSRMNHFPSALEFAQKLPELAEQLDDPSFRVQAHFIMGNNLFFLGDFRASRTHLQSAVAAYHPSHHQRLLERFGENASITSRTFLSFSLWFLGYPEQARKASIESIDMARQKGHQHGLGYALASAGIFRRWMRQSAEILPVSGEAMTLAARHNFALWQAIGMMSHGWAQAMEGSEAGVFQLAQSVAAMRVAMNALSVIFLSTLADLHVRLKQYEAGLKVVHETMHAMEVVGDYHYHAELHRLRGECLLGISGANADEAAACFREALETSRRQGAKSLELRAAMSFARHFNDIGLLRSVYGWFTEGFDTPDLVDAAGLLARSAAEPECAHPANWCKL